jgi:hypothetical protein
VEGRSKIRLMEPRFVSVRQARLVLMKDSRMPQLGNGLETSRLLRGMKGSRARTKRPTFDILDHAP